MTLTTSDLMILFDRPASEANFVEMANNEEYTGIIRYLIKRNSAEEQRG